MDCGGLVGGGKFSCKFTHCPDQTPIDMYKLLIKTCCPTYAESPPPQRHFIQRQRQITVCLQKDFLAARCCNANNSSVHWWEVYWLARITFWAKSGGRPDPHEEWWFQQHDPSLCSSVMVTNVRMRRMRHTGQETRLDSNRGRCDSYKKKDRTGQRDDEELDERSEMWMRAAACLFRVSCKPQELLRHLLLMQKHARDAVPDI